MQANEEFLFSRQVIVVDKGNDTVLAEFSGGSNLEIRVENRIISVMLITLPNRYRSLTRGLMGNYNRKPDDDLVPRNGSTSISVDSSAEEIFSYGNTCKYDVYRKYFLALILISTYKAITIIKLLFSIRSNFCPIR